MRVITRLAVLAALSASARAEAPTHAHHVRVLVLNFDPIVPSSGGQRLHEFFGWNDPHTLAQQYISELSSATGGLVQQTIVRWMELDEIPLKADGYQYTIDEYVANWQSGGGWHMPDTMKYGQELASHGARTLIDDDLIDEVWLFGAPYFGFWEAAMMGPGAFFINGGVYGSFPSSRPFAVMGFNYERGVAEMMHSLGHRVENSIARVFGGWQIPNPQTDWDLFAANAGQSSGLPGVGNIHYPANGQSDYDYGNSTPVLSSALDWSNYPNLTGATTMVSSADWATSANSHLGYMRFWYELLPHAAGRHPAHGRSNDWYAYVYDWLQYDGDGQPLYGPPEAFCASTANSTGMAATMGWSGSPGLAANDLVLEAGGMPPMAAGVFFHGSSEVQLPFGPGLRCVAGQTVRLPLVHADAGGHVSYGFDLSTAVPAIDAGSTRSFQLWYRDAATSIGFNTSDGLRVVFCP
ncbi:MAG: hypothetical protein ACI8PZ_006882 [Myxococcota bacterium]|jgi:hypothetical protein